MKNKSQAKMVLVLLPWIATIVWLSICIFLSSQSGSETGRLSTGIAQKLIDFLGLKQDSIDVLNSHLRTAAHIITFFVLTMLSGVACGNTFKAHLTASLWSILPCSVLALLDEIRKAYIPGRHCSYGEAGLNIIGAVLGGVMAYLIISIVRRINNKKFRDKG